MIAILYGVRLVVIVVLLGAVYTGSRVALVVVLALIVVAQEVTSATARQIAASLDAIVLRAVARADRYNRQQDV